MHIPTFCSMSFLEQVTTSNKIDFLDPENIANTKSQAELLDLILHGSTVFTDVSCDSINDAKENNPYINFLLKNLRIKSSCETFNALRTNQDNFCSTHKKGCAVYMLSPSFSGIAGELQKKSGYYILSPSSSPNALFEERVELFKHGESKDWSFAKEFLEPCHSLLIADPYLFKEQSIKSCIQLLQQTLSKDLKTKCHISLIGSAERKGFHLSANQIKSAISQVKDVVEKKSDVIVEGHIYNGEDFHDRYIITNNVFIFLGNGLDIIKKTDSVSRDSTWVAVKPFKRVNGTTGKGVFFYKIMLEKLKMLKTWIEKDKQQKATNPLFWLEQ